MKLLPLLAFHGGFGGRGFAVILGIALVLIVMLALWPGRSETK